MTQLTMNTLKLVTTAQQTVSTAELNTTLTDAQRSLLVRMYWDLDKLQQNLILTNLSQQVAALTASSNDLKAATQQLQGQVASLNNVAQDVNAAANAVGVLVNVLASAAAAGIA